MLSIDEAIEELKSENGYYANNGMTDVAEFNTKIIRWLEELKDYRDKNKMVVRIDCANSEEFKDIAVKLAKEQYNKAIDDFVKALQEKIEKDLANPDLALECKKCGIWKNYDIAEIAEQLKAGGENERSI